MTKGRSSCGNPVERSSIAFHSLVSDGLFPLACDENFCRELGFIIGKGGCTSVVETGTFKAETTRFLAEAFPDLDVFSCDVNQELVAAARELFRYNKRVTVSQASSPEFIEELIGDNRLGENPFFFLDAHWYDYLPLNDELRLILGLKKAIICIHDFRVPARREYGFDVYGNVAIGMECILPTLRMARVPYQVYFPEPPNPLLTRGFRNGTRVWNFARCEEIEKYELRGRCYILINQPDDLVKNFEELVQLGYLFRAPDFPAVQAAPPDGGGVRQPEGTRTSRPSIDLVVPDDPIFSWNQREGWISAMTALGVLNQVYRVNARSDSMTDFFSAVRATSADFVLILCCDHHLCFLHDSPEKKEFWKRFPVPVICHSIERIIDSPFPGSESKSGSAAETFDGFIYIDEFASTIFTGSGKPSMWIPQYVDDDVFRAALPFDQRKPKVFFRGQIHDFGIPGVYAQRQLLLAKLQNDPNFSLSEAHRPRLSIHEAAALKGEFHFTLNAPANCPGYSSSLYEALACGCAVLQYALPEQEVLSRGLFEPGQHFIEYDQSDAESLKKLAAYACRHWRDFSGIARSGMELCLARHTIKTRMMEIIDFVERNWPSLNSRSTATPLASSRADEGATKLEQILAPKIKDDEFYFLIEKMAREEEIRTVLEIGSSSGGGSTGAFVSGISHNPLKPQLYCVEVSTTRFRVLQEFYADVPFVHCYNVSSVPASAFPSEREVELFYRWIPTGLNNSPLELVIGWLRQDVAYVQDAGVPQDGIRLIREEKGIDRFDMVLIDGSEFLGKPELDEVYGSRFILLDDVNGYKNYENYRRLCQAPEYRLVQENLQLRSGYAVFARQ